MNFREILEETSKSRKCINCGQTMEFEGRDEDNKTYVCKNCGQIKIDRKGKQVDEGTITEKTAKVSLIGCGASSCVHNTEEQYCDLTSGISINLGHRCSTFKEKK